MVSPAQKAASQSAKRKRWEGVPIAQASMWLVFAASRLTRATLLPRQSESSAEQSYFYAVPNRMPLPAEKTAVTPIDDVGNVRQHRIGCMMAPVGKNRGSPSCNRKGGKEKGPAGLSRKPARRWDTRQFKGSLQEGQGFAIWRKQKIQRAYKKLLRKERRVNPQKNVGYTEDYPEHLKHLYLAEEEMLQKQQKPKHKPVILEEKETQTSESNVIQRKVKAKTSNQKAKEDYEKIKTERNEKKEAAKKRREEREKAQKLYKQKKMETYKILSKRTRKGQPNLNLQMEYLLQKIEQKA